MGKFMIYPTIPLRNVYVSEGGSKKCNTLSEVSSWLEKQLKAYPEGTISEEEETMILQELDHGRPVFIKHLNVIIHAQTK